MELKLALIGFGVVGRGFTDILIRKKEFLQRKYNLMVKYVGICDMKYGSIVNHSGLDPHKALEAVRAGNSLEKSFDGVKGLSPVEFIDASGADVVVEATWTNLDTGEPAITHIKKALSTGRHVITTNKGPIALAYRELSNLAKAKNVKLLFSGTVMSGTPSIRTLVRGLAGCYVSEIAGILNGTTNYILTKMEEGLSFNEALRDAQQKGYAEADPTMDVDALDPSAKIVILANIAFESDLKPKDVIREGIRNVTLENIKDALRRGKRVKLIARAWSDGKSVKVKVTPEEVDINSFFGQVKGTVNAVMFRTDSLGDVYLIGRGAGGEEAGQAILADLIELIL
ncbi:MAG: homoserine dehydrogenase [Sulfolobales archaeon]|nr:homoserine dehydrogenase [Sulfolobales archaeon]MCX8185986.1 homoserine dehydrogenase [Sulfolobales archaeon]MDW7969243.1 homoserine dehydrogenase [Sulfolobales archaeon]